MHGESGSGEWFGKVDAAPRLYYLYSLESGSTRSFQAFKADTQDDHLRLLFTIDALNEGVHVDDIDGVILFRPTVSPIVYKQQIGRALTAGNAAEPVIFDIVNNFENLYSVGMIKEEMKAAITYYNYFGDGSEIVTDRFQVIDELMDCRKLFDELEGVLSASWDLMYEKAEAYAAEHGNLEVPQVYKTCEGYSLGAWISAQRRIRAGSMEGLLDEERIARLDAIGMRWESESDLSRERHYAACVRYKEKHGNLLIPFRYITDDGIKLGVWIRSMRNYKSGGIRSNHFTPEREKQLDELGMVWDQPDYIWERNYAAALKFYKEHDHLNVPRDYIQDGVKLGIWVNDQKKIYRGQCKGGSLSDTQIDRLNRLHIQWERETDRAWNEGIAEARNYAAENGVFDAPYSYVSPSGFKLGRWLSKCRERLSYGSPCSTL